MKNKITITLREAYNLIEEASAVIIDRNAVVYPSLYDLEGSDENEWLYLSWEDNDNRYGNEFNVKFIEEKQEILFDGSTIYMKDSENDDCELTLLVPMSKF